MSVLEMQLAAIKEILESLAKTYSIQDEKVLNLSQHYDKVKAQYGNVLQKLAQ